MSDDDLCGQCAHDMGPHAMLSLTGDPLDGGIMLCPVGGCQCFSTWSPSIGGEPTQPPPIPDRALIEELRERVQYGSAL